MKPITDSILISWPGGSKSIQVCASSDLLSAALSAGVPVPHSCRRSDCLQCAAFVLSSNDPLLEPGSRIALCQTSASNSGAFELLADPFNVVPSPKLYPAKVVELSRVARDTILLRLVTPHNQTLEYVGGQYASIVVGTGLSRKYSIATVHQHTRFVDFYIRLVAGGQFGNWLNTQASIGSMVRILAPYGTFEFKRQPAAKTLFIATGTGIVPIFAMLQALTIAETAECGPMHLIWGNRSQSELFLKTELAAVCARLRISQCLVFSQEEQLPSQRVTEVVVGMDLRDAAIYTAGNPEMIRDVQVLSQRAGVNLRHFHSESFPFDCILPGEKL